MPFPGLWGRFNRILIVRKSVLVCRNLQFSSTKWPKAYLINYYMLNKLQESVGNTMDCKITCTLLSMVIPSFFAVCQRLNDKGLHDMLRPCGYCTKSSNYVKK